MKIQGLLQDFDFPQTKSDDEEEETSEDFSESDDYESSDYEMESNSDDDKSYYKNIDDNVEWSGKKFEGPLTVEDVCEFGEEDIMKSDDDLDSNKGSDNEKERPNFPVFNPIEIYRPTFELGMIFSTRTELRQAIHSHAIITRRSINITKNDKSRLHAKCVEKGCGWKLHALKVTNECTYQVRTYDPDHSCGMSFHVKNLKSKWLSSKYLDKFKCDPKRNLKGFRIEAMKDVKCHISSYQAYNAKRKAIEMIEGVPDEQYSLLWDFVDEVKRTNPGSTVIVGTDQLAGENRFDRIYMCLHALRMGFLAGCRPLIGVDGCHLKDKHGGVLLTAVGVDPNNNIYPIAYALVEKETRETWDWFLTLLKIDLHIEKDYEWTFISDKQKGLIQAFEVVFPNSDHRFCVRHMHSNFKNAGFRGQAFKSILWKAAKATTVNEFSRNMEEMNELDENAFQWLNDKPPQNWSRSHFNTYPRCDMLLNNGCESFNSSILEAREKPIVSMLEWIMEYLMTKLQKNRDRAEKKWSGDLCPRIKKRIHNNFEKLGDCIPIKADDYHYQISCFDGNQYNVDLAEWTCGCRKWDLSGIPCKHAISAIVCQGWKIENFTHSCYKVETYKAVYAPAIMPMNGRNEWKKSDFIPPLPPKFGNPGGRPSGRPIRARRRESDEPGEKKRKRSRGKPKVIKNAYQLKRQQKTLKCSQCGVEGHNKRACKMRDDNSKATQTKVARSEAGNQTPKFQVGERIFQDKQYQDGSSTERLISVRLKQGNAPFVPPTQRNHAAFTTSDSRVYPPKMFEQLQQSQMQTPTVNIKASAQFVGGQFIPSMKNCITKVCSESVVAKGGKKFVHLSNLNDGLSQRKSTAANKKNEGKKPMQ